MRANEFSKVIERKVSIEKAVVISTLAMNKLKRKLGK